MSTKKSFSQLVKEYDSLTKEAQQKQLESITKAFDFDTSTKSQQHAILAYSYMKAIVTTKDRYIVLDSENTKSKTTSRSTNARAVQTMLYTEYGTIQAYYKDNGKLVDIGITTHKVMKEFSEELKALNFRDNNFKLTEIDKYAETMKAIYTLLEKVTARMNEIAKAKQLESEKLKAEAKARKEAEAKAKAEKEAKKQ